MCLIQNIGTSFRSLKITKNVDTIEREKTTRSEGATTGIFVNLKLYLIKEF